MHTFSIWFDGAGSGRAKKQLVLTGYVERKTAKKRVFSWFQGEFF